MGWFKKIIKKWLGITPAAERNISITETFSHDDYTLMNWIWYRADPCELSQFYKNLGMYGINDSRFWFISPESGETIRKMHSGLPPLIINTLNDITCDDILGVDLNEETHTEEQQTLLDEIMDDNKFIRLIKDATKDTLVTGDGAFKISVDTSLSKFPIVEFYSGSNVGYDYKRGRLQEVIFKTVYSDVKEKQFILQEHYGRGYVRHVLTDSEGVEVPLTLLEETAGLTDVEFPGDYMMAVPLSVFKSSKYKHRGQPLLDGKYDAFDGLDEIVSQWLDAIRLGRANKFIPEDLIPRDQQGNKAPLNPITNQFHTIARPMEEDADIKPTHVQPEIAAEKFLMSYVQFLDMCLMGVISPSTLGIDVKKLDNSEAQREKEKATLYSRNKIIAALTAVIPEVVSAILRTYDTMYGQAPGEYEATITFGEYANPSFDATVDTIGKARLNQIMSFEMCVEQLYGNTLTDEEKEEEVSRLKEQFGVGHLDFDFPGIDDTDDQEPPTEDKEPKDLEEETGKEDKAV